MTENPKSPPPPPYRADYHVHVKWCCHATGEMRDYVEAAIARGLTEIGFAAHLPVTIPIDEKINLSRGEFDLYLAEAQRLRDQYSGRIDLLIGGELDYIPGQEAEIEEFAAAFPYDYLLGAVHFVDGWNIDNPRLVDRWKTADVAAVYRRYYDLLIEAARTGYFDIVSHFDLVKKFGYRPDEDVTDAETAAADAVAEAGMTVEINTAGWRKPVGEQYPSETILRMLNARNIPLCLGSDAHAPEQVGHEFDRAAEIARSLGWTDLARYRARERTLAPYY